MAGLDEVDCIDEDQIRCCPWAFVGADKVQGGRMVSIRLVGNAKKEEVSTRIRRDPDSAGTTSVERLVRVLADVGLAAGADSSNGE